MTPEQLTRLHRAEQIRLARDAAAHVDAQWAIHESGNLARVRAWEAAAADVMFAFRERSVATAGTYMTTWAAMQGEVVTAAGIALTDEIIEQVYRGLRTNGPSAYMMVLKRTDEATANMIARKRIMGAVIKAVLDGSRDETLETIRRNERLIGWKRLVSADACDFCLALAGRGAVYSAETVSFAAHNNCSCIAEGVLKGRVQRQEVLPYVKTGGPRSKNARSLLDYGKALRDEQKYYA